MDPQQIASAWEEVATRMSLASAARQAWLDALMEVGTGTRAHADDMIISVLDANARIRYLLLNGEYCVQKQGDPELVKPAPELIGEMAEVNPSGRRTASIRAVSDVDMISFSWEKMHSALKKRMSDEDYTKLLESLDQYACNHFTE